MHKIHFSYQRTLFDRNNKWFVNIKGIDYHLEAHKDFLNAMALLELPINVVRQSLGDEFPYADVILFGLESSSNYWVGLALLWLDAFPLSGKIILKLEQIMLDTRLSQKNRHTARKYIKRAKHQ